jgi:hypothetical protein
VTGGSYFDGNVNDHAFIVNERQGVWGKPMKAPGAERLTHDSSYVDGLSCPKPGFCATGITYYGSAPTDRGRSFLVDERHGLWHRAIKVPGFASPRASAVVGPVSCGGVGACAAGGGAWDRRAGVDRPFVVDEKRGKWRKAIEIRGLPDFGSAGSVNGISCSAVGSCAADGTYLDPHGLLKAFVMDETHGVWRKPIEIPGLAALNRGGRGWPLTDQGVHVGSISCASPGSCAVVGSYADASAHSQAFVVTEMHGKWGKAMEVPGTAGLNVGDSAGAFSVSCAKAGFCGAGGSYKDGSGGVQAFVVNEANGVWDTATEVPGSAAINSGSPGWASVDAVSCGGALSCAAVGYYSSAGVGLTQSFLTSP